MDALIDPTAARHEVVDHLDRCAACSSLFAFARERHDLDALAAWRRQLAAHVEADLERRDFDRAVARRIATSCGAVLGK